MDVKEYQFARNLLTNILGNFILFFSFLFFFSSILILNEERKKASCEHKMSETIKKEQNELNPFNSFFNHGGTSSEASIFSLKQFIHVF